MSLLIDNDFHHRIDLFEPGDKTALVCVDVPEVQRLVVENLSEVDYKIHTGLFTEDILLKLQSHDYNVVVVSENFNASTVETNPILQAIIEMPSRNRRRQMIVLIGASYHTDSEMQAFGASVDLVVNLADVPNLKHVIKHAAARREAFYKPYIEALEEAGIM